MNTAKEQVRKMLDQLPDDASFEDIQHYIYVYGWGQPLTTDKLDERRDLKEYFARTCR